MLGMNKPVSSSNEDWRNYYKNVKNPKQPNTTTSKPVVTSKTSTRINRPKVATTIPTTTTTTTTKTVVILTASASNNQTKDWNEKHYDLIQPAAASAEEAEKELKIQSNSQSSLK
jgi:basic membrane lipoprotein Med (substrate-binding protein (PBP1-ABC) superfamily)